MSRQELETLVSLALQNYGISLVFSKISEWSDEDLIDILKETGHV